MYIPTIPTDNIYKFFALGGLLLAVISVLFPFYQKTELSLKVNEVDVELEIMSFEVETLNNAYRSLFSDYPGPPPRKEHEALDKRFNDLAKKKVEIKGKQRTLTIFKTDLEFYTNFQIIGIIAGGVLSLIGFILWYFLVQRPSDTKLRALNAIDGDTPNLSES